MKESTPVTLCVYVYASFTKGDMLCLFVVTVRQVWCGICNMYTCMYVCLKVTLLVPEIVIKANDKRDTILYHYDVYEVFIFYLINFSSVCPNTIRP